MRQDRPPRVQQPAPGPSAKFQHKSQRPLVGLVAARPSPFSAYPTMPDAC